MFSLARAFGENSGKCSWEEDCTMLTIVQSRRIELILLFLSGTSELNDKWSKKPVVEECAEDEERAL
jgi:hypothetical protein